MESKGEIMQLKTINLKVKRVKLMGFEVYQVWVNDTQVGQYWSEQLAQTRLAVEARKLKLSHGV